MTRHASIIFSGDIMSNIAQNHACRTSGNSYDYSDVFSRVKSILSSADYRVGNLETPFAGAEYEYSGKQYSFNTPLEFAQAVKDANFNLVSLANNHCLDRGVEGLYRTLDNLDKISLPAIGCARNAVEREKPFIADINGIATGFLSYTYGTNAFANSCFIPDEESYCVNLFQPQETREGSIHLLNSEDVIASETQKLYGTQNDVFKRHIAPYLEQMKNDITRLRNNGAEYIIMLMHSGGQYNPFPDSYTRELVKRIREAGADAIIGNHPHVVHECIFDPDFTVAYSLGNFTFTPGDSPASKLNPISAVSVAATLEIEETDGKIKAKSINAIPLRSVILEDGRSVVSPVESNDADAEAVLKTFYGK